MRNSRYYQAEELVRSGPQVTLEEGNLWAGGQLLVWHPGGKGEQLELRVPILESGKHALHLGLALNQHAGRITAKLDGHDVGFGDKAGVIDLHVPYRMLSRQYGSDPIELTKGEHVLTLHYKGGPDSVSEPKIGIDYVAVQKRE
jgi:hypothetical protein